MPTYNNLLLHIDRLLKDLEQDFTDTANELQSTYCVRETLAKIREVTKMLTVDFTGTVSRATMREQDLVTAFMDVLEQYDPEEWQAIKTAFLVEFDLTYEEFLELPDDDERWRSEALFYILHEDIWEAMQDMAPEGTYFGASEGDGADFGYWPLEDY